MSLNKTLKVKEASPEKLLGFFQIISLKIYFNFSFKFKVSIKTEQIPYISDC